MKKILNKNKGLAATDALIAVLIITLFTGIIATLLYNIYISNASLKRMSAANLYIVDIFEYIDRLNYSDLDDVDNITSQYAWLDEIDEQDLEEPEDAELQRMWGAQGLPEDGYQITILLDKYVPEHEQQEEVLDLVRQVTVKVEYKVGNRNQEITMTRIKTMETATS